MTDIAALVFGGRDECFRALDREALAEVVTVPSLAEVVDSAREARAPLVWLVDSGAMPAEGALGSLLDAECDRLCQPPGGW